MSTEFDASFVSDSPINPAVLAEQQAELDHWMRMPSALANAKLHAQNELQRLIGVCNRLVWGRLPSDLRAPSANEIGELLQRLSPEDSQKLDEASKLAAEQRHFLVLIENGEKILNVRLKAEQDELAMAEAEQRDREEFETHDEAGKEARFQAWRAARGRVA